MSRDFLSKGKWYLEFPTIRLTILTKFQKFRQINTFFREIKFLDVWTSHDFSGKIMSIWRFLHRNLIWRKNRQFFLQTHFTRNFYVNMKRIFQLNHPYVLERDTHSSRFSSKYFFIQNVFKYIPTTFTYVQLYFKIFFCRRLPKCKLHTLCSIKVRTKMLTVSRMAYRYFVYVFALS